MFSEELLEQNDWSKPRARETAAALLRAAAVIRRRLETTCAEKGLTFQQFSVLRILQEALRDGEGPLPTMKVGERMIDPEPGITRMMERLERKGFVRRQRSPEDARLFLCRLTRKGQATLRRLDEPIRHESQTALGALSDSEVTTLDELLSVVGGSQRDDG